MPMTGSWVPNVSLDGHTIAGGNAPTAVHFHSATPNFFSLMEMAVTGGRGFDNTGMGQVQPVALINQEMVRRYFGSASPLGHRISILGDAPERASFTIVSVLRDSRIYGTSADPRPEVYVPFSMEPMRGFWLALETAGDPLRHAADVHSIVRSVAPDAVITDMQTVDELLVSSVAQPRFHALLLGILAGLAVLLALAGIYAVLSYSAAQRRHEMGVRLAVGAGPADIMSLVLGRTLGLTGIGIALGAAAAWAVSRTLTAILYGTAPTDARSYLGSAVVLLSLAVAAAYVPARRAASVDPMIALREE